MRNPRVASIGVVCSILASGLPSGGAALASIPADAAVAGNADSQPLRVERIVFRGNRALPTAALRAVAAPYLGRDLTADDIEALCSALTHRYTDHGYITSSVVVDPDASYHDGVLSFLVIEGRIKEIRVQGANGLRPSYVVERLHVREDDALNTDVLRSRLQRLSEDPMIAHVTSNLETVPESVDAILDVNAQRAKPYSLSAALNNYRPPSIGEKSYDIGGQLRNLTGFGDVIDSSLSGPLEFSGGIGYTLNWQIPLNRADSAVSLSAARVNTVYPAQAQSTPEISSTIERQEFKLSQAIWGSLRQQVNVGVSIANEEESTPGYGLSSLSPGLTPGSTHSLTASLIPQYSYRSAQQYLNLKFTALHADLRGYPPGPATYPLPDQNYFVWVGQLHDLWEFPHAPFEFESRAILQRTHSQISDLHALEIGGINSVRGYQEDEVLVSNATNLNFDFRWLALPAAASLRPGVTLGTFFDWASGHDVDQPNDTFSSYGLTFRLKWAHVQADLAYGLRLIHPAFADAQHGSWQDHGIHVQVVTSL